jgi:chemotaxis protein methyltransferase CheR
VARADLPSSTPSEPWSEGDFAPIVAFLRNAIGISLEPHRMGLMQARLRSRLQAKGFSSFIQFGERVLKADPTGPGMQLLIDLSTVNHTAFFREPAHFTYMAEHVVGLLKEGTANPVRIWSAGCSTGQEAYSLAMLFADEPLKWQGWTIDILGTDVSSAVVDRARNGTYTQFEVQRGLGIAQMIKWFEECDDGWRAVEPLRKPVRFQVHNLLEPPPHPGQFDIILCRNVLLYLNAEKRGQAFDRLASAMAPDGALMLGAGETVIGQTRKLAADRECRGLYRLAGEPSADRRESRVA